MLSKDPSARPSMHEIAVELRNPPGATLVAPVPPWSDATLQAPQSPPPPDATLPAPQLPPPSSSAGPAAGRGRRRVAPVLLAVGLVAAFATGGWLLSRAGQGDPSATGSDSVQTDGPKPGTQQTSSDEKDDEKPEKPEKKPEHEKKDEKPKPTDD